MAVSLNDQGIHQSRKYIFIYIYISKLKCHANFEDSFLHLAHYVLATCSGFVEFCHLCSGNEWFMLETILNISRLDITTLSFKVFAWKCRLQNCDSFIQMAVC